MMLDDDEPPPIPNKPSKWTRFWRVAGWLILGLIALVWAVSDWKTAQWAIGAAAIILGVSQWWDGFVKTQDARYFDLRRRLYDQQQVLEELRYRMRKLDKDRGAL